MSSFSLAECPVYQQIEHGRDWGDIQYDDDFANGLILPYVPQEEPLSEAIEPNWEADVLAGWTVPDLSLRKGIWENFPVDVVPHSSQDGTDRYSIRWNEAKLTAWRQTHPDSWDEYQEYESWCWLRLADALAEYSHKYTVEDPIDDSLCIIAMAAEAPRVPRPAGPRALDVLKTFPVSWDRDNKVHRIKLHRVNAAKLGAKESDVRFDLMGALSQCRDCVVTAAPAGYLMTVTLL